MCQCAATNFTATYRHTLRLLTYSDVRIQAAAPSTVFWNPGTAHTTHRTWRFTWSAILRRVVGWVFPTFRRIVLPSSSTASNTRTRRHSVTSHKTGILITLCECLPRGVSPPCSHQWWPDTATNLSGTSLKRRRQWSLQVYEGGGALYTAHALSVRRLPTASGPSYTAGRRIPDNKHIHRHQKGGTAQWCGANGGKWAGYCCRL